MRLYECYDNDTDIRPHFVCDNVRSLSKMKRLREILVDCFTGYHEREGGTVHVVCCV